MADTRDIEARLREFYNKWGDQVLADSANALAAQRADLNLANVQLDEAAEKLAEQNEQIAAQRAEIAKLRSDLAAEQEHHQRAIVEHQAQLAAQRVEIERLNLKLNADMEIMVELQEANAEARREKIGRLTTRIRQLERGYDLLRTNLHRTEAQLAKAQRDKQTILERNNRRLAELQAQLAEAQERAEEIVFSALHEVFAVCGHCGKRKCPERKSNSRLPDEIFKPIRAALDAATGRGR